MQLKHLRRAVIAPLFFFLPIANARADEALAQPAAAAPQPAAAAPQPAAPPAPQPAAPPAPQPEPAPPAAPGPKAEPPPTENPKPPEPREPSENEGRLPLAYAARPLTLPRFILNPIGSLDVAREDATLTFLNVGLRGAFGITDNFEVEANVAPLQLQPVFTYGQRAQPGPSIGATYRLGSGGFEAAAHIDATAFTLPGTSGAIVRPGLAFRGHTGGDVARIDFGIFVPVTASFTTNAGLQLPVALAVNLTPRLHLGVESGFTVDSFSSSSTLSIPLGAFSGYTIEGKDGPILEIDPFFRWPRIASGETPSGGNSIDTFQVGVQVGGFLYL